ncbi:lamin tail domain-containing protein [Verrucomicrobiota bacterium sgz303538]
MGALCLAVATLTAAATPVINEIMYHPPGAPGEDPGQEWIELYNNSSTETVDLSNWKLTKGIDFTFPSGTALAPGAYLVVAADVAKFQAAHSGFTGQLVGGWTGRLSNSSNTIRLEDAAEKKADEVTYADEGDWALRARGVTDRSHQGWDWIADHDGLGKTLELRNSTLASANSGQNWATSAAAGGTPGTANSAASSNIAPLIQDVKHRPRIPRTGEQIRVSAKITDEVAGATAKLFWRVDGSPTWNSLPMADSDGDGDVDAIIPGQANLAVIEFYVQATDASNNSRTWPAPARTSAPGVVPETFAQTVNALLQVDNTFNPNAVWIPGAQPIYRVIMTAAERAELQRIWTTPGEAQSNAAMNATFVSVDGTGEKLHYLCSVRNRGNGSRTGPPNNALLSFLSDNTWNGRRDIAFNCRFGHSQTLGALLMERMGVAVQEATPVQVRFNGSNLAETGTRMYGSYARIEQIGSEWVGHHFPLDPDGNLYQVRDINAPGDLSYEGTNPTSYTDSYFKQTNQDVNDYSDLIALTNTLNKTPTTGTYKQAINQVLDLDEWLTYLAANSLIGNLEGGISTGRGDDYSLYRGLVDTRFKLVEHDLDTTMSFGDVTAAPNRSILTFYEALPGLNRMMNDPEILPDYYAKFLDLMDRVFNPAVVNPIIEQAIGYTPQTARDAAKNFVINRRNGVLAQIQQNYSLTVTTGGTDVDGFKQTTDGSVTFGGTFNVAKTRSITVNGTPATLYYRTNGTNAAGSWKLDVLAGSSFLQRGVNPITVKFFDGTNGTGNVLQTLTSTVYYGGTPAQLSGTLTAGGIVSLNAPDSYLPGTPFLVKVDLKDLQGNLDRQAWTRTATLTASNGLVLTPNTVTLYNGVGSALVSVNGGSGTQQTTLVARGGTSQNPNSNPAIWNYLDAGAAPAATWKSDLNFDVTTWKSGFPEFGAGDGDERTVLQNVTTARKTWYFRHTFNVTDPAALTDLTLRTVIDDGAVVYINGTEVKRINMPAAPAVILDTDAAPNRVAPAENTIETFTGIPAGVLVAGQNLIAVEVHNSTSQVDLSFDLELIGNAPNANPGNFTLSASIAGSSSASKAITSRFGQPQTPASGTLPAGETIWSGIVNVTGDVTVPAGSTLTIQPGTHVLMAGTAAAGDTTGAKLIVNGTLNAVGTASQPISITTADPNARWGQINFSNAQPSTLSYVMLSHAGHSSGVGHTGRGPMLRVSNSSVTIDDTVLADGSAKAIYSSGTCNFTIRRSLITRMVTGPELEDGASLLMEDSNIQLILPDYRDSSSPAPDDEDCLYVHNSTGRPVTVRRCVFARCGDDVFDCLAGPITVEDSILREGWDKGMSLLNNDLTISRTLIIDCDKAIVPKSNAAVTRTINVDRVTMVSEDHDTSQSPWGYAVAPSNADPDTPSTGLYTQNKSGQSNTGAILAITAKNCIILAKEPVKVDAPYSPANTVVTYSDTFDTDTAGAPAWTGTGNLATDPLFVSTAGKDFHLQANSPCVDSGDPASGNDADNSRADMGALPFTTAVVGGTVTWNAASGPYYVADNLTVPTGVTLIVQAGTSVYVAQNKTITVNGTLKVQGTESAHVVFSHVPGTVATGDADPIAPGTQTGPPKWGGIRIVGPGSPFPMSTGHEVRYADFINAQPATATGNQGSLGIIRAEAIVDHCTWSGTHLRMLYGKNCSLTVTNCIFPDEFNPADPNENPVAFNLDNIAEPLKVEMPDPNASTNPELVNNPNYVGGMPVGGHWRVYYNHFYGNKGHNDVFDADSGRWGTTQILDCRYNWFHGLTGDEHIDLGGDAYIASNIFERGNKDQWTSDTGYSNAISSGDKGSGTTIWVARNVFFDLDHAINCKVNTGTIFEHNTVANFHADFTYSGTSFGTPFTQDVKCSAVNMFIPEDGTAPTRGDGGYLGFNLISNIPRLVSGADTRKVSGSLVNDVTTKLEFNNNLVDQITDQTIGANHPGGIFNPAYGVNTQGAPGFVDAAAKNYSLRVDSAARGSAPSGFDYGASISEWAFITGEPPAQTPSTSATLTVGGPGLVAFKWRLDGGAWSAPIQIGDGGVFPRSTATKRTGTITLNGLPNGTHTVEVLGQDAAGNWQDNDPAKPANQQAIPTAKTWTVNTALQLIRINEVLADSATVPDTIELYNAGATAVSLTGWSLTDNPLQPAKYAVPAGTTIPAGGYLTVSATASLIQLDKDGDTVYLYEGATLRDSVAFGHQIPDYTIGRIGTSGAWTLCQPTLGAANTAQRLGDPTAVRINEWFTSGNVLYDNDWIELASSSSLPVSIAGLRLTDNSIGNPAGHTIAPLSFIAANGFVKLIADGKPSLGATHLGFSLDAEQEHIALYNDATQLDAVFFLPQTTDYSMGRDGTSATGYAFYELPTAGLANGTTNAAYANALALLRGLRITEIMYNPSGGNDYEFIELRNVGATTLQLDGVKFVQGIDFTFPAMTLAPGKNVVLVADVAKFRQLYGSAPNVGGQYLGRLDNSGEKLAIQLPPPFDANILTFSYSDTWQTSTDGLGKSLVVINPLTRASTWGDKDAWTQSSTNGGDPDGVNIPPPHQFSAWLTYYGATSGTEDGDRDGISTFVEYALGMDPTNPNGDNGPLGLPEALRSPDGHLGLRFELPENLAASQGHGQSDVTYQIEASDDLTNWSVVATKNSSAPWSASTAVTVGSAVGGLVPITAYETGTPSSHRYMRVRAMLTP